MTVARGRAGARLRVFLTLAVVLLVGGAVAARLVQARRQGTYHERSGLAMGTFVTLRAAGPRAPAALEAAMAEIDRLDALFDYGRPQSDVGRLNAAAGAGPVTVQPDTVAVLVRALHYAQASDGAFDPTIAPLVDLWGFRPEGPQAVPEETAIRDMLSLVDYRRLRVDAGAGTAELLDPGTRVDLGGIAKGFAVDRAAAVLREAGVESAIIDIGGNIYCLGLKDRTNLWRVGLQHPRRTDAQFGVLRISDLGVATSGDYQRFFEAGGRRYHHVLDPRTGRPASGLLAASVAAPSAMDADAASTAAFVLGLEAGQRFLRQLGLEGVFYAEDGQVVVTGRLQPVFEAGPQ
ncbi:MAG: FAD:protein FMN transferase [Bacillota bacterium]|nr:FAD:protein FMN transferase [Bacillota bacterium]